jgi:hypothetical protein
MLGKILRKSGRSQPIKRYQSEIRKIAIQRKVGLSILADPDLSSIIP